MFSKEHCAKGCGALIYARPHKYAPGCVPEFSTNGGLGHNLVLSSQSLQRLLESSFVLAPVIKVHIECLREIIMSVWSERTKTCTRGLTLIMADFTQLFF